MLQGLHLELTNICMLKCPGCPRTQFINIFPQHWKNQSLDAETLMNFLDIDLKGKNIYICGHYGDPIYHPDFFNIISQLKSRDAILEIVTNGSYKKKDWWKQFVALLSDKDTITFSIDGLPKNFTKYRINADWQSIEIGMRVVAQSNCSSKWSYIPFSYNENDIKEAELLCKHIGIKEFEVNKSDRWDEYTEHLKPSAKQIGTRDQNMQAWKQKQKVKKINPACLSTESSHFISADGFYTPCCFSYDFRFYYKNPFGLNKNEYNIRNTTITKVLENNITKDFFNNLDQYSVCQFNCGDCDA